MRLWPMLPAVHIIAAARLATVFVVAARASAVESRAATRTCAFARAGIASEKDPHGYPPEGRQCQSLTAR